MPQSNRTRPAAVFSAMSFFRSLAENSDKLLPAAFSGVLLTAAFPGINVPYAAWAALFFLLAALRKAGLRQAFLLGLLAGLIHYTSLLYWLVPTMRIYGGLPLIISITAFLMLSAYLSLYPAVFSCLAVRLLKRPAALLFISPVLWICLEYLRTILFSGFPWSLLGYSQYSLNGLIQIADIFGVYGVSGLIVLGNTASFLIVLCILSAEWQGRRVRLPSALLAGLVFSAAFCLVLMYSSLSRYAVDQCVKSSEKLDAAVVQGNISQMRKWDMEFRRATIEKYFRLSKKAEKPSPDLIIWPETAAPFYFGYNKGLTDFLLSSARETGKRFIIGAPSVDTSGKEPAYYNSAYLVSPEGRVEGRYDKVHLVPFGEYAPLRSWLPFLDTLVVQAGDFRSGKKGSTISWDDSEAGVLICYEAIFPVLSTEMAENGADLLVNITNDAWFGKTSAPRQHFSMAVFRAVENRRALVRAANTGISGFIDPTGRIIKSSSLFEPAVMSCSVPLIKNYSTFYTRHGDFFAYCCFIAICFIIVLKLLISSIGAYKIQIRGRFDKYDS